MPASPPLAGHACTPTPVACCTCPPHPLLVTLAHPPHPQVMPVPPPPHRLHLFPHPTHGSCLLPTHRSWLLPLSDPLCIMPALPPLTDCASPLHPTHGSCLPPHSLQLMPAPDWSCLPPPDRSCLPAHLSWVVSAITPATFLKLLRINWCLCHFCSYSCFWLKKQKVKSMYKFQDLQGTSDLPCHISQTWVRAYYISKTPNFPIVSMESPA